MERLDKKIVPCVNGFERLINPGVIEINRSHPPCENCPVLAHLADRVSVIYRSPLDYNGKVAALNLSVLQSMKIACPYVNQLAIQEEINELLPKLDQKEGFQKPL